jgi:NAD(P)-dependent dehydrogenase (short-subunit alcohol dehydrogenase family)
MEGESTNITRRQVVAGLGTTLAAVAVSPALAAARFTQKTADNAVKISNPTTLYPKPPFKSQPQPWPGLQSKMNPVPDCGETSYKGSGRLIKKEGRKAIAIPGDLRDEAFCKHLVQKALSELGGLDIIVNNAGRQQSQNSILDITSEAFDSTMKTNIYAPFWIIREALPHLPPGSAIIGTTSEQAYDPSPDLYDYAQTKAATMNYVKSLAKQLGPKGIRVNGVAPGPIWTALQISGGAQPEKQQMFGSWTPLSRPGQPAELASIYVQLAAADASFANGQVYGSSGGSGQP